MLKLYNGDCLELMQEITTGSVDMILCDLPYGTTACKWDTIIPFEPLWKEYWRIIKSNGAIVLTCSQPFTSALIMSQIKNFKYDWVWKKPKGTGHLNAKKMPMRDKEDIAVFYKEQCLYKPQFILGDPYKANGKGTKQNREDCYNEYGKYRNDNEGKRYPKQIQEFAIQERDKLHPTQKPIALFEYLIKTYTNEEDLVLDNCMGSGTTGVACKNLNRNFIGIELDPDYFQIAAERIKVA